MATWQRTGVDFGGANQAMANAMRGVTQAGDIAKGFVDRIREDDRELQRQKEREQDVAFREKDFSLKQLAADREAKKFSRDLETEKQLGSMAATLSNGLLPEEQIKIADMASKGIDPTAAYNNIIKSRTPQQQLALSRGYVMPEGDYDASRLIDYRQKFEQPVLNQMSEAARMAWERDKLAQEIAARKELEQMQQSGQIRLAGLQAKYNRENAKVQEDSLTKAMKQAQGKFIVDFNDPRQQQKFKNDMREQAKARVTQDLLLGDWATTDKEINRLTDIEVDKMYKQAVADYKARMQ